MVAARPLVVVAGAEPSVTDDLADRLRESCIVRTAYSTDEVLDRLDADVDVVLVAPGLGPGGVGRIRRAVEERELPCRLGRLDDESEAVGTDNAVVDPSWADQTLRSEVDHLATLAQYRTALDEYFTLAQRNAGGDDTGNDPQERLSHARERLDDAAADLDPSSLFEAALRDADYGEGGDEPPDDRSDEPPDDRVGERSDERLDSE